MVDFPEAKYVSSFAVIQLTKSLVEAQYTGFNEEGNIPVPSHIIETIPFEITLCESLIEEQLKSAGVHSVNHDFLEMQFCEPISLGLKWFRDFDSICALTNSSVMNTTI